ncbi:MAG: cysteine-rich CWC family protein [Bacteroidetes bacterium]|nr:cysteine-rich CWC family protein [Bacteroidota bacterium]
MCKHENKHCPRCGTAFECKPGNITQCQCYGVVIPADIRAVLDAAYADCLCRSCLETLASTPALVNKKNNPG